jgi:threonine dehydratase
MRVENMGGDTTYGPVAANLDYLYDTGLDKVYAGLGVQPVTLEPRLRERGTTTYTVDQTRNPGKSFKFRAMLHAVHMGVEEARAAGEELKGFTTASAGNAGSALAAAAQLHEKAAAIFMASTASEVKKTNIRNYGAKVHDICEDLTEALTIAQRENSGWRYIAPFNDLLGLTGAATLPLDTLKKLADMGVEGRVNLFAPLGGGSLLTGTAIAVKYARQRGWLDSMDVEVRGVQMEHGDPGRRAVARFLQGLPWQTLTDLFPDDKYDTSNDGTFAIPGDLTMPVIADKRYVTDILTVTKGQTGEAMHRMGAEPAGALSWAGLRHFVHSERYQNVRGTTNVAFVTGANVTPETRAEYEEVAKKEARAAEDARRARVTTYLSEAYALVPRPKIPKKGVVQEVTPTNLSVGKTRVCGGGW